jgi:hypothetical protein
MGMSMKLLAGAILILAATVSLTGGLIAEALCLATGRTGSPAWPGYLASVVIGLFGFGLLLTSLAGSLPPTPPPPDPPRQDDGPTD